MTALDDPSLVVTASRRSIALLTRPWGLGVVAVLAALVKYGISWHPEWARLYDAAVHWPDVASSPLITAGDRSLLSNVSLALVAGLLGVKTVPSYFLLCGGVAVVALLLPFLMRFGSATFGRLAFIVVAGGGIAPVLLAWVGGYDALVVISAIVAGLARRRWLSALGWMVLAFSHSAVAVVALLLWLPVMWSTRRERDREAILRGAWATASVVCGWLVIRTLTDEWGGSTDRFALFRAIEPSGLASSFGGAAPLVVFSALGVAWLLFLNARVMQSPGSRTMLVVALAASLLVPFTAVDQTRILVLSLTAAVMTWIDRLAVHLDATEAMTSQRDVWRTWMAAAIIVPVPVVWMGTVLYPGWALVDDWARLLSG